jgi:predicted nucleic acid-binding protein
MPVLHLLDACAVIAYFDGEAGAGVVKDLLDRAKRGEITLTIHAAQVIEVYYNRIREVGSDRADALIRRIYDEWPVTVIEPLDRAVVREAAYRKAAAGMSLADTFLVATAACTGATLVTSDWTELEPVAKQGEIPFCWTRPKPQKPAKK